MKIFVRQYKDLKLIILVQMTNEYKYNIDYSEDDMKQYVFDYAYTKLLKGMGLFSIGAITVGLAVYDRSNESKANLIYILGGVVCGSYGLSEGWKGLKLLKKL